MLSILCARLMIKVKVGIPESFKVRWCPLKKTGSSHLKVLLIYGSERIMGNMALHNKWGGGGGYFRNFSVGMCRWDPGTLNLYQS